MKVKTSLTSTLVLAVVLLAMVQCEKRDGQGATQAAAADAAPQQAKPKPRPAQFSETVLCSYQKDVSGGFCPSWVAYILDPKEDKKDDKKEGKKDDPVQLFVELNGKRLGPYSGLSRMFKTSRDGRHIAFAAEKGEKWHVVVDGQEKWAHPGLLYPWYAWSPTLEGNSFIPQTRAAILEFSPDGRSLAYFAQTDSGKYAVFVDGKPGPEYPSINSELVFFEGKPAYCAWPEDKKIVLVHGAKVLGPYDSMSRFSSSEDGAHFCLRASTGDKHFLIVDGREVPMPGEVSAFEIWNNGTAFCAYKSGNKVRVRIGDKDLPGDYDEVANQVALGPDGKTAAFWAKSAGKWSLVAGDRQLPGFDGYYYFECGGEIYSIMWDADSKHVAYYARKGTDLILALDGQESPDKFAKPPGLAFTNFVDSAGTTVGTGMMQAPRFNRQAFVQCAMMKDKVTGDPFAATLWNQELCFLDKQPDQAFMIIGSRKEGPYKNIHSTLLSSPDGKHYLYIVETGQGQQFVIDGKPMPQVYEAIYKPSINPEEGTLEYLAVKGGNVLRVVQPIPAG